MDILNANDLVGITLKPNATRAKIAIAILGVISIIDFMSIASQFFALELFNRIAVDDIYDNEEIYATTGRQENIQVLYLIFYLSAIIFFLNWFRRAYGNLYRVRSFLRYSEWMATWSFFLPIINLFRPYKIAMELAAGIRYKIKDVHPHYSSEINLSVIGVWWTLYIASGVIGQYAFRLSRKAETINEFITSTQVTMISDGIDLMAAVATIIMIRQISADEKELWKCTIA